MVAGDFNGIREPSDRMGGSSAWIPSFDEFGDCLMQAALDDPRYIGHRFTWATSSGESRKQRKIDRVLINDHWNHMFSFSEATFLAPGISDHSPMVVGIMPPPASKKLFKYFNFWSSHPSFLDIVAQVWATPIRGTPMFVVCSKLKLLKGRLKQLNRSSFSDIFERTEHARLHLASIQQDLQLDFNNHTLLHWEVECLRNYSSLRIQEEAFFKQKSRIRWLKEGDMNTKFFHHSVNKQYLRNHILSVSTSAGQILIEPARVSSHITWHFEELLNGRPALFQPNVHYIRDFIGRTLQEDQIESISRIVTEDEIQATLFSLAKDSLAVVMLPLHLSSTGLIVVHHLLTSCNPVTLTSTATVPAVSLPPEVYWLASLDLTLFLVPAGSMTAA
ncbi:uncharacterized protein LOC115738732 [Rhodamnia argentea]|uniref:Uncharacterized protein LOC115738732 n=1 Tax=Rhodamnia argentea TaxID=178133 RepID=A0A8B8NYF6_9MYRT|nr:uncharacterized protein LOC115738732 [Rhodamnia argentea]